MTNHSQFFFIVVMVLTSADALAQSTATNKLLPCIGAHTEKRWNDCIGEEIIDSPPGFGKYVGEWKNGTRSGYGTFYFTKDHMVFKGTFKNGDIDGQGTLTFSDGTVKTGVFNLLIYGGASEAATNKARASPQVTSVANNESKMKEDASDGFCVGYLAGANQLGINATPANISNRLKKASATGTRLIGKISDALRVCGSQLSGIPDVNQKNEKNMSCLNQSFSDARDGAFAVGFTRGLVKTKLETPNSVVATIVCSD